ncbi:hypothetical protein PLESTB_001470100 [Pleodorina starrii]|uniref:Uncharacterized protein n=1 Tax=Pleodorina starrii TaxID=330485 RepID=A0A9W6BVP4_9CHLO|nr:hypothetical protein PLESTM_001688400 [Pleodorina starrii]GLC59284.1 hypothetical protein PLESTB_001470100 [Pleodorina starrii]GLC74847.1 hypothetical protein PLESTF_001562600 [Pleodorina starrii]
MRRSGPAERYAPQNAAAKSRDAPAVSGSKPASDGNANHDAQGNPSDRHPVLTDPKAVAIFRAVNSNTFDHSRLPAYLRSKSSHWQTHAREQPRLEPVNSGILSASSRVSLDSVSTGAEAHQAGPRPDLPADPIPPAIAVISAATAATAGARGTAAAAAPPPPTNPAKRPWGAVTSGEAKVNTTCRPAPPPPRACPPAASLSAPATFPQATPHQPVPSVPSLPAPPVGADAPPVTLYPSAPTAAAPPLQPLPPAAMPHPPPACAPPPPAPAPAQLPPAMPSPSAQDCPPLPVVSGQWPQPVISRMPLTQAPGCVPEALPKAAEPPSTPSRPPPLPVAAPPAGLSRLIALEPIAQVPAVPLSAAAPPPAPAAGPQAGPWTAPGAPQSTPEPPPPQQQFRQPAAAAADAAAAAATALEACLQPQPSSDVKHKELRVRAVLALAMSRAWDDCVRAAHHNHHNNNHHNNNHRPGAEAEARTQQGPPRVVGRPAPGPGASGQAAAPGCGAAAGELTRQQLLQFGWTTVQLDELFAKHFLSRPPGRMAFISVAVMYEELGRGIACRGLRPKPGGGGADMVLAPCDSWGRERAAEMERLRQVLTPLEEEEARRAAHEAAAEAEVAERERAARRQAQRQRQELEPARAAAAAAAEAADGPVGLEEPELREGRGGERKRGPLVAGGVDEAKWPAGQAPRLREILCRTRMYLRMKLRPQLIAKDPQPVPLAEVLAGLRQVANVDLDAETVAELGADSAELVLASLWDAAETRRGADGSVGVVASEHYRQAPVRSEAHRGMHWRCNLRPASAQPQQPAQPAQQPAQQPQQPAQQPQQPAQQPQQPPQQPQQPPQQPQQPPQQPQQAQQPPQSAQPQQQQPPSAQPLPKPQQAQQPRQARPAEACQRGTGNPGQQRPESSGKGGSGAGAAGGSGGRQPAGALRREQAAGGALSPAGAGQHLAPPPRGAIGMSPMRLGGQHLGAAPQQRPLKHRHRHQQQRQQQLEQLHYQHHYQQQQQHQQQQCQQQQQHHHQQHHHQQQHQQQQGAARAPPTLSMDLGSRLLCGSGSWPHPSIAPGDSCGLPLPLPLPSVLPATDDLPQPSPDPSPPASLQSHPQGCVSDTAAHSSATAAAHSLAGSGGSSCYFSGGSCVVSSASGDGDGGGGGSCSRALSSVGPDGSGYDRLKGAACGGRVKRVTELPPHLRPKPASGARVSQPAQPPHRPLPVQTGGLGATATATAAAAAAAAVSSPRAQGSGAGAGGLAPAPVSREWQTVGSEMTVRIDQWALPQAEALGADCGAACRAAGCGSCWQVTGYREAQIAASSWGPTREAAIQALRQVLLGWAQQSAALG